MGMLNQEIVIMGGARTPFGKFGGGLKDLSAADLAVIAGIEALRRAEVKIEDEPLLPSVRVHRYRAPYRSFDRLR